jgi:hypothetical protein
MNKRRLVTLIIFAMSVFGASAHFDERANPGPGQKVLGVNSKVLQCSIWVLRQLSSQPCDA